MAEFRPGTPEQDAFLRELVDAGLLVASGVPGVFGRGAEFERVRAGFDALVSEAAAADAPERLAFPPLLPREQLERIGYLKSFPTSPVPCFPSRATTSGRRSRRRRPPGTPTGATSSR